MIHIAIFASGKGSNAQAIIKYFANHPVIRVALVVSNNPTAGVVQIAHRHKIISAIVNNTTLNNKDVMERLLNSQGIEFIALAGFLQMVPPFLLEKFPNKIVNIHPALLPKHGGKGMYGAKVHNAVLAAGDTETGMTIHYVNEKYDEGEVILQKSVAVQAGQTAEQLAQQVNALEHAWYPRTIEMLLLSFHGPVPVYNNGIDSFYANIRTQFPKLSGLDVWQEEDPFHSHTMTVIAREVGKWVAAGQMEEAKEFMQTIESAWRNYDDQTTSFIYTDLIVTIMELPKLQRESLKSMMGTQTREQYQRLLSMYRESDV